MRIKVVTLCAAFAALSAHSKAVSAERPAQSRGDSGCEVDYVIQPGDTLALIADIAFGTRDYTLIFARNLGLTRSLGALPDGETLVIPCVAGDEGMTPDTAALAARMAPPEAEPATPGGVTDRAAPTDEAAEADATEASGGVVVATADFGADLGAGAVAADFTPAASIPATSIPAANQMANPVRILTADGLAPYAGEDLRGGGMIAELIADNMRAAGDDFRIVFINDRPKHLRELMIGGSFDLGFPWVRPPCEADIDLAAAAPDEALLCEAFAFTAPFYENVLGFYVRRDAGATVRATFADFADKRICRPGDGSVSDLVAAGLSPETTTFLRPATSEDCLRLLLDGQVDAVSAEVFSFEDAADALGRTEEIEELPDLSLIETLHAVAPKSKPGAVNTLMRLSEALVETKVSGGWFRVVSRHLGSN